MPVQIGTLDGLVDYKVLQALKELAAASNAAEAEVIRLRNENAAQARELTGLRRDLDANDRLTQQLQRQVTQLQNP